MTEVAIDKKRIISELTKSSHGNLDDYLTIGKAAAYEDPNFFAHLIAWNHIYGQVRDAQVALPVIALSSSLGNTTFIDNALAHLADLRPQVLKRALLDTTRYDKATKKSVQSKAFVNTAKTPKRLIRRFVTRYLRELEGDRRQFEYVAVQHKNTLHQLYAHYHVTRPAWVGEILFHGEKGQPKSLAPGVFDAIRQLHLMSPEEAAGTIAKHKIPFLIARGALGAKATGTDAGLALIKTMSPSDLVTNVKWLDKLGVKSDPVLRAAFEGAIGKAATSKSSKVTLKTTRAAEVIDDEVLSGKLRSLQEKQLDKLGGIDGDWLILGDKSGSMKSAIETAVHVSAILARMVKGRVHLMFFDNFPYYAEVTGRTLEEIKAATVQVVAGGGTNMDCGIRYALDKNLAVDGIVFVSDGANHGPAVIPTYRRYCEKMDAEPTLYFYQLHGEPDTFSRECALAGVDLQTFDLRGGTDYYALPNLVQTMRVARYSLIEDIMATPLRTLDEVLERTKGMVVLPQEASVMA